LQALNIWLLQRAKPLPPRCGASSCFPQTYPTREFATFPEALHALARQPAFEAHTPRAAAFGVAGPVADNCCHMTNLSWVIDGDYLTTAHGIRSAPARLPVRRSSESVQAAMLSSSQTGLALSAAAMRLVALRSQQRPRPGRMAVLNDFEANGYGVTAVSDENVVVLNNVPAKPKARGRRGMQPARAPAHARTRRSVRCGISAIRAKQLRCAQGNGWSTDHVDVLLLCLGVTLGWRLNRQNVVPNVMQRVGHRA
jgi:hypothetical protein